MEVRVWILCCRVWMEMVGVVKLRNRWVPSRSLNRIWWILLRSS